MMIKKKSKQGVHLSLPTRSRHISAAQFGHIIIISIADSEH